MTAKTDIAQMQQETVRFLDVMPPPPIKWRPKIGVETYAVLKGLSAGGLNEAEVSNVRNEAVAILSRCMPPRGPPGHATGIAIGQVQSGKTTSFTTLASLAADNGYPLVIVLAGTSTALFEQSEKRFAKALRLDSRGPLEQRWVRFANPDRDNADQVRAELAKWRDARVPEDEKRSLLLIVMKNHARIRHLNGLLNELGDDLQSVPAIVIDDEADQAGLNSSIKRGGESTTYARIMGLRRLLPWHTYVQYTATPQAPLLITIIDMLSPEFPVVLTPGPGYTGGDRFFGDGAMDLVRAIPQEELDNVKDADPDDQGPPESLLEALRVFFVGVAAGRIVYATHRKGPENRSMMVHPSQRVDPHGKFAEWIKFAKRRWAVELRDSHDAGHDETVASFQAAWNDLSATVDDLPAFDEVVATLDRRIDETVVLEMNAVGGRTPTPDWKSTYSHILVGGQAMDRGFTVEGLTVTYMPRGVGTGNADTVQQRARFFGYKSDYLGYCRAFLEAETADLFRAYVEHETDIHRQMRKVMLEGGSLKDWKRAFLLHPRLRPTREAVLKDPLMRENFASSWWNPRGPHDSDEAVRNNQAVFEAFIAGHKWTPFNPKNKWTDDQIPRMVQGLRLKDVMDNLLCRMQMPRAIDSLRFTSLQLQLQHFLESEEDANLLCDVFEMSQGKARFRTLDEDTEGIPNLFQGANPNTSYPGDREIKASGRVSIQLHWVDLAGAEGFTKKRVPVLAVWVPEELSANLVVQAPGGR